MRLSTEIADIARWPDVRGPLNIACSKEAMEQIRRRAVTGVKAEGTGLGAGGLLLGEREGGSVRVLDSVELPCSHSLGPPFRLTPPEIQRSRELFVSGGTLPVIGWYFSRLKGELQLSRAEVALFEELFPSQWQITLLLLPDADGSARAAFFFRDPAGEMVKVAEETLQPWAPEPFNPDPPNPHLRQTGAPQFLTARETPAATSKLSWVLTAIIALAAGAALFMFQNSIPSKPQPAPAAEIP